MQMSLLEYQPIISVIVPVYNVEAYLPRCVDSILNQSFSDFELILVDDGSPDNCGAICDAYAAKDSRVRVIHQKNSRLSAARNAGIDIAVGEWITLVDSDDWIHKDYLRILLSGAKEDTDIVICRFLVTVNDSENDIDQSAATFTSVSLKEIYADHYALTRTCFRLFKRETLGDYRFITGTEPTEDSCFNELFFRESMKFRITDAQLYYYYMRKDSATHSTGFGRGALNSIGPLLERLAEIDDSEQRERIITRCYKYVLSARYGEKFSDDYADVKRKCRELLQKLAPYSSELPTKQRLIFRSLSASPLLYRAWRILDDPTLLAYEKRLSQKQRERKQR